MDCLETELFADDSSFFSVVNGSKTTATTLSNDLTAINNQDF